MNNGFILLWRKITDSGFYKDSYAVHLAIHLIMKANHEPRKFIFNSQEIVINRGQCITGQRSLSIETGIASSTIYRKLQMLQNIGFLNQKVNRKFTLITLCKYNDYQDAKTYYESQNESLMNHQRITDESLMNTNKELKECKELKRTIKKRTTPLSPSKGDDGFDEFWKAYPKKKSKPSAIKAWLKLSPDAELRIRIQKAIKEQENTDDWCRQEGRFIPYPATWLNNKRWEDEKDDPFRELREKYGQVGKSVPEQTIK